MITTPGAKVPRPPAGLDEGETALWRELARAVEHLGTFGEADAVAFRRMVRVVYRAELCPLDAAPSASGRLEQAAASALASFGLSPLARERVTVPEDTRSPDEKLRDLLKENDR